MKAPVKGSKGDRCVCKTEAVAFCFWQILFALMYITVCGSTYICQVLMQILCVHIHILYVVVHNFVLM